MDSAVLTRQPRHIDDLFALIGAEPHSVDLRNGAVGIGLGKELIELLAEGGFLRVVLPEGKGAVQIGELFLYEIYLRLPGVNAFKGRLVAKVGINCLVFKSCVEVGIILEIEIFAVREIFKACLLVIRAGENADFFAVVISGRYLFSLRDLDRGLGLSAEHGIGYGCGRQQQHEYYYQISPPDL